MTIELYDTVLLKDGRKGSVVDRIGDDYVVDVDTGGDFEKERKYFQVRTRLWHTLPLSMAFT